MSETMKEQNEYRILMLGLVLLVALLVFASVTQSLIVPTGVTIELDTLLFNLFLSTSLAIFSVAFINQGISEENDLLKIICFVSGFILVISTLFGTNMVILAITAGLGSVYLFFLLAFAFTVTAAGIFVLRRI